MIRIRLGLSLSSLAQLRQRLLATAPCDAEIDAAIVRRTARHVRRAALLVPFASCLTQALAAQVLLARHGIRSNIQLGVRTDRKGALIAHAWLLCDGRIVLGGDARSLRQFSPLTTLGPTPP